MSESNGKIVKYAKNACLASNIILNADTDNLLTSPALDCSRNARCSELEELILVSLTSSTLGVFAARAFGNDHKGKYTILALLPVGILMIAVGRSRLKYRRTFKQIDNFICQLEQQADVNCKVIEHLNRSIQINEALHQEYTNLGIIEAPHKTFAIHVSKVLENVCKKLIAQLRIQAQYSSSKNLYKNHENMSLGTIPTTDELGVLTKHFQRLSEFYNLLASKLMSTTVLSLANVKTTEEDFEIVLKTINDVSIYIKDGIDMIEEDFLVCGKFEDAFSQMEPTHPIEDVDCDNEYNTN